MTYFRYTCVAAAAALLVACGGSDDSDRGALKDAPVTITTLTAAQIDAGTAAAGLQALSGKAKCDVKVVALNYITVGAQGTEETNASGVMLVPGGAACAAPAALVAYAKGTDMQKPRTLANPQDNETFLLAAMYAAQGYAVVATDYLGFAKSGYAYHPYLHADSEARTVIDSVRAARAAAPSVDHATEFNVVAGAHLAGPYNLSGSLQLTDAIAGFQFFVPYLVTSWQKVYGNVYTDVKTAFKTPYSGYIENLLPSPTLNYTTLVTTGALPGGPGVTPNQARDAIFQPDFLLGARTSITHPLYVAAKKNDLLGWSPKARVMLCGGAGDPTVPPAVHQQVMKADFDSRGLTNVTSVDVDAMVQSVFGPGGKAPTDPTSAAFATYYGNYHGTYEPPFCHAQARVLFDAVK